jgi:hypothetical protein
MATDLRCLEQQPPPPPPFLPVAPLVPVQARFNHLVALLGDRLPESELLKIVRNQVLIDIQARLSCCSC